MISISIWGNSDRVIKTRPVSPVILQCDVLLGRRCEEGVDSARSHGTPASSKLTMGHKQYYVDRNISRILHVLPCLTYNYQAKSQTSNGIISNNFINNTTSRTI